MRELHIDVFEGETKKTLKFAITEYDIANKIFQRACSVKTFSGVYFFAVQRDPEEITSTVVLLGSRNL